MISPTTITDLIRVLQTNRKFKCLTNQMNSIEFNFNGEAFIIELKKK